MVKITTALATLAGMAACADAYTLTAYEGKNCKGKVQQTIKATEYGDYCNYFKEGASSIKVSGGGNDFQWIFFNQYPCSKKSQVGSFLGNHCINQGATKLKAVSNVVVEGTKRDVESEESDEEMVIYQATDAPLDQDLEKRQPAGRITTWKSSDCTGPFTNQEQFPAQNLPVTLNSVGSAKVENVRAQDTAFACSDSDCKVKNQVAILHNGKCAKNLKGKNVRSAMVIGIDTPPKEKRNLLAEAQAHSRDFLKRGENITCAKKNLAGYKDALEAGDKWQGSNGLACCCHLPGGPDSMSVGTAKAKLSDNIRCPVDPSGTKPPPSSCPMNCNEMRGYVYSIATKCKTKDGKTGGTLHLSAGEFIQIEHS